MRHELILNFHGIGTPHSGVPPEEKTIWMSRESFVSLLDCISGLRAAEEMAIAITFDDGNQSDVAIALPELRKRNLTATFFVCAGRLETPEYLDRSALRDLLDAGMEIGSHGMHHRDWRKLDAGALADEISTARKQLEDVSGTRVATASIPFGSYDRRVLSRLRAEGFARVYTSDRGLARPESWLTPRNTLGSNSRHQDVVRLLAGKRRSLLREAHRLYKMLR